MFLFSDSSSDDRILALFHRLDEACLIRVSILEDDIEGNPLYSYTRKSLHEIAIVLLGDCEHLEVSTRLETIDSSIIDRDECDIV